MYWSGIPGIVARAPLKFEKSRSFKVTYGTGVIGRGGGPGGYDTIHDKSQRGAVVELIEDDGKDKTKVYVDVSKKDATIGDRWVKDFIPY